MGELIGAQKKAINYEGWVVQGEMVCVNGPVEQLQREDALFLPSLSTQIGMISWPASTLCGQAARGRAPSRSSTRSRRRSVPLVLALSREDLSQAKSSL